MSNLLPKEKHALAITTTLLIALWVLGPLTKIISTTLNLGITFIALIGFGSYFLFKKLKAKRKFNGKQHPLKEVMVDLESQMQITLDSIQARTKPEATKLFKKSKTKPWVLLIGPQGSGKTSLLAKSGIEFSSPFNKTLTHVSPTKGIDWWISDDGVFIDPAAKYCLSSDNETDAKTYWQQFLKQTAEEQASMFTSVCLVIDLPNLVCHDSTAFESLIHRLQQQIINLANWCKPLFLNLIITQIDQVSGFAEYFSDLNHAEQKDSLGISLFDSQESTHKTDLFRKRFSDFIQGLNVRTCSRLHHERNLERRKRIIEFPLQFESLGPGITKLLESIPDNSQIVVNHVFFCSSQQSIHTHNLFSQELHQAFHIEQKLQSPLIANQQSLFINKALIKATTPLATKTNFAKETPDKWWHFASYPLALGLILATTGALHHAYQKNVNLIHTTEAELTTKSHENWLDQLSLLTSIRNKLNASHPTESSLLGFKQANQIKDQINQAYSAKLQGEFVNYLNDSLSSEIKTETEHNSPHLYNALQIYLMFSHPEKMNTKLVSQWFKHFWADQLPEDLKTQKLLNHYLQVVLQLKDLKWDPNKQIITKAQKVLEQQPLAQNAFKILFEKNSQTPTAITSIKDISGLDLSKAVIPTFYSLNTFTDVYQKQIPTLAKSVLQGNWVIGKPTSEEDESQMVAKLRELYVTQYFNHWQQALDQIKLKTPQSLIEANNQINLITNAQSPLWQLYQQVIATAQQAGAQVQPADLSSYMPDNANSKPVILALTKLHTYLENIINAPSSAKASYDQAVIRFKNKGADDAITTVLQTAAKQPEPVKAWMNTLGNSSWHLMLAQARTYLNALWQTNVVPVYNSTIENHFPIYHGKLEDISIKHFNAFFGPGGLIQGFFNQNLFPFVDMSSSYWTWKKLDGQSIPIPQETMDMLMRASMIQRMFYSHEAEYPSISFELTPQSFSKNTRQFILNVGGQMMHNAPGSKQTSAFNWPGPDGNFVTMRFNTAAKSSQNPTLTTMGPWAWLHLLDHASVTSTTNPKQFDVNFHLKGSYANYMLTTDNITNPYTPKLLAGFRCPDSL